MENPKLTPEQIHEGVKVLADLAGIQTEPQTSKSEEKILSDKNLEKALHGMAGIKSSKRELPKLNIWRLLEQKDVEGMTEITYAMQTHLGGVVLRSILIVGDNQVSQAMTFLPGHEITTDGIIRIA